MHKKFDNSPQMEARVRDSLSRSVDGIYGDLFSVALKAEQPLSEWHEQQLGYIADIFGLSKKWITRQRKKIGIAIWPQVVRGIVERTAANLDAHDEPLDIGAIQVKAGIAGTSAFRTYEEAAQSLFAQRCAQAMEDYAIDPDDAKNLKKILDVFGVSPGLSPEQAALFQESAFTWLMENGELDPVDAGINLKKGEECFFEAETEWFELRKKAKSRTIQYHGLSVRVKLAKGIYYRAGQMTVAYAQPDEVMTQIDQGTVYITNKRIIFDGDSFNRSYRHTGLLRVDVLPEGFRLEREKGRAPLLVMPSVEARKAAALIAWFSGGMEPDTGRSGGTSEFLQAAPKPTPKKRNNKTDFTTAAIIAAGVLLLLSCCWCSAFLAQ